MEKMIFNKVKVQFPLRFHSSICMKPFSCDLFCLCVGVCTGWGAETFEGRVESVMGYHINSM